MPPLRMLHLLMPVESWEGGQAPSPRVQACDPALVLLLRLLRLLRLLLLVL